tara:strand:- start:108 stop:386 length:279 start_codon:yes stop_codon:yes gene_type:complete
MLILDKPPILAFPQPSHLDLLSVDHSACPTCRAMMSEAGPPPRVLRPEVWKLHPGTRPASGEAAGKVKSPLPSAAQVVDPIEAPAKTQTFWL